MRLKRCIAMLMLVVYLLAVVGPVCAALTCHCVAAKAQMEHSCCSHCNHDDSVTHGMAHAEAPCCGDSHSIDIELYTRTSDDSDKLTKRILALDLPMALAAESIVSVECVMSVFGIVVDPDFIFISDQRTSSCGLRAPPVLV